MGVGDSLGVGASVDGLSATRLVLQFPDVADAYLWIFPRPGGASVGIAFSRGRLSIGAAEARLRRFLARHFEGAESALADLRFYRYPIPTYSPRTPRAVAQGLEHRLLLVGDAAGVADPLTREGIRYSMLSGVLAAESLLEGRPWEYPDRLRENLDAEMRRATLARRLFFEDRVAQWMVPVARAHPRIRGVLRDLLDTRQGYVGLRRRLLKAAFGFA